uniref:Uncharacterized protein n=1 Tax=Timema bartmani TaxID=61472 RepID=A0A7R9F1M3_9NEOP|nr:unnamed protein product [Timema bartmani]
MKWKNEDVMEFLNLYKRGFILWNATGVVFILVAALIHKSNQGYEITDKYEIPMVPRFLYIAGGVSIFTGFVGVIAMLLGRLKIVLCLSGSKEGQLLVNIFETVQTCVSNCENSV